MGRTACRLFVSSFEAYCLEIKAAGNDCVDDDDEIRWQLVEVFVGGLPRPLNAIASIPLLTMSASRETNE